MSCSGETASIGASACMFGWISERMRARMNEARGKSLLSNAKYSDLFFTAFHYGITYRMSRIAKPAARKARVPGDQCRTRRMAQAWYPWQKAASITAAYGQL